MGLLPEVRKSGERDDDSQVLSQTRAERPPGSASLRMPAALGPL